jgi:aryl-alcohol dehydrogenase-like predicted oxidoreductase
MQLPRVERASAITLLRRAMRLGVNHLDTAAYYGPETANEFIRAALRPYPANLVIVSKVGYRRSGRGGLVPAQRPSELRAGVEADLRSLQTETITVVYLRLEDPGLGPACFEDQLAEMVTMRDEGLIGAFGISNTGLDKLRRAADAGAVCCQNAYSLINRSDETLLELCAVRGVAWVPYFPLGGSGLGFGSVTSHPAVKALASQVGATAAQVGLAWLLNRAPNVLLIPGTTKASHLEENVRSASVRLSASQVATLDALGRWPRPVNLGPG